MPNELRIHVPEEFMDLQFTLYQQIKTLPMYCTIYHLKATDPVSFKN